MSNAEKAKPEVEIDLKGDKRLLVFDNEAFCDLEKAINVSVYDGETWKPSLTNISGFLWAGLKRHWPEVNLKKDILQKFSLKELIGFYPTIMQAITAASPEEDTKKNEDDKAPVAE